MTTRIVTDSNGLKHITNEPKLRQTQHTWVGLTDEEIDYYIVHRLRVATKNNLAALIRLCEAKLKEKNA